MPENDELKKYLDYDGLGYLIQRIPRTKIRVTFDDVFAGETAICSMGTTTYTKTVPATEPYELVFPVNELGTWTIATSYLGDDYGTTIEVTGVGTTATGHVSYVSEIDGSTVTPTDDITTWLKCANIEDPSITTLADVLANRSLFETLIANSNACKYMARSTTWAGSLNSASGLVPTMTSNTTPSGQVEGGPAINGQYPAYMAFDSNNNTYTVLQQGNTTGYVQYNFPEATNVKAFSYLVEATTTQGITLNISCSDDNNNFTSCGSYRYEAKDNNLTKRFVLNANYGSHRYWRLTRVLDSTAWYIIANEVQFYDVVDITHSQDAMALIGKYDYCSNALLSNATWANAIANSDYFEEVLNVKVPVMTGDTAPSGNAICSSYSNTYNAYRAFDGNTSTDWRPYTNNVQQYVGYKFTKNVKIYKVYAKIGGLTQQTAIGKIRFGYTNSSNQNVYLTDIEAQTNYQNGKSIAVSMTEEADNFKLFSENNGSGNYANLCVYDLQFYGRASSELLVPLVPTMTSATTPSGEVTSSKTYSSFYNWHAFDGSTIDSSGLVILTGTTGYIDYEFPTATVCNVFKILNRYDATNNRNKQGVNSYKIRATNDGSTWVDLASGNFEMISSLVWQEVSFQNSTAYKKYELQVLSNHGDSDYISILEMQFYAKTVQTNIIHSAPNDTIYMMDNGSQVPLCTTNSDGDGILDFTQFMDGTYTLYSSVAKDPTNLSNDYSKSVRITKTSYGCTTEVYLMPDTIRTLYWYGNNIGTESGTSANGWAHSNYTMSGCTYQINKVYLSGSSTTVSIVGSKVKHTLTKSHFIVGNTTVAGRAFAVVNNNKNLSASGYAQDYSQTPTTVAYIAMLASNVTNGYQEVQAGGANGVNVDVYAMWYE